jgi:protein-S-isoprenylcysteine O-methyltransferase Ste14
MPREPRLPSPGRNFPLDIPFHRTLSPKGARAAFQFTILLLLAATPHSEKRLVKIFYWTDVIIFIAFAAFIVSHEAWSTRFLIGVGIAIAGLALSMLARAQLGRSFSIRAQARMLVTTGLYSKFRHPIYLFRGIAFLGLFIAWGKLIPLLCFLLIYPVQILRARKEGKVLEQAFGEEYRRYRASTWF